ncbi:MAG TPA: MFS transporter, partial [Lactobacillus sp.]|nr:MFS transporter [Lactobacillus sp.]
MHSDKEKFGVLLPIILISYFMILLDNSIVFTSTVKIAQDLSLNGQTLAWVTNAYALTFGSLLLLGGRLGDLIGRKQIFLIGISIFSIGSLLVGASQNAGMIIGMRALQGIGAAVLAPTTLALIMDNYQGTMRTRAIAYYGATAGLGASVGLVIGGLIASYFSWRLGFLLNVPVGLVLAIMGARYIKNQSKSRASLDWAGTFFSVVGLVALVYGINGAKRPIMMFLLAIISLGLFGWREDHTNDPLMPLVLFKNTERFTAYVARFFYAGAVLSYFFLTPQAMQRSLGFTPLLAAIGFLPETV